MWFDVIAQARGARRGRGPTARRIDRLCELNVIEQVANVCQTTIVGDAWDRGQRLSVHGWSTPRGRCSCATS